MRASYRKNTRRLLTVFTLLLLLTSISGLCAAPVAIGTSHQDVIAALGEPDGTLSAGSNTILTYGKAKIKLKNGLVTSFSPELNQLLVERAEVKATVEDLRDKGLINYRGKWVTRAQYEQIEEYAAAKRLQASSSTSANSTSAAGSDGWYTDFRTAVAKAKRTNKKVLINFTGSDWCGWCQRLDAEVFSQPSFIQYAKNNYVLLKIDFPRRTVLPDDVRKHNKDLANKYQVRGYPTIIVVDGDARLHARGGYVKGGPRPFLESIQ